MLTPGQRLRRARLTRVAVRAGVFTACAACAARPGNAPLYCAVFCAALQLPAYLLPWLHRQSSAANTRAIGAGLCVLGAGCAAAAAYLIVAAVDAPPRTAAVDGAVSGAGGWDGPHVGRRRMGQRRFDPLWWFPASRGVVAGMSPIAAAAAMRLCSSLLRHSDVPSFGLKSRDEYAQARDDLTETSVRQLGTAVRLPNGLSAHARNRLADVADGATGVTRAEALRWVRHVVASTDDLASAGCGFRIGEDGRRIDEGADEGSDSGDDLDEPSPLREGPGSPLRSDDYCRPSVPGQADDDDAATWRNLQLVRLFAARVEKVSAQRRALLPGWLWLCGVVEEMWGFVLPGL